MDYAPVAEVEEETTGIAWEVATIILAVLTGMMLVITGCFALKAAGSIGTGQRQAEK